MILFSGSVFYLHRSTVNVVLKFPSRVSLPLEIPDIKCTVFSLHLQNVAGSNLEAFHMQSFLLPTEADKKTEYSHLGHVRGSSKNLTPGIYNIQANFLKQEFYCTYLVL